MSAQATTVNAIHACVLKHYINTGDCIRPQAIAEATGLHESTVRRAINEGDCSRLQETYDVVEVIEKNYHTVRCERRVVAYIPTHRALREKVLEIAARCTK